MRACFTRRSALSSRLDGTVLLVQRYFTIKVAAIRRKYRCVILRLLYGISQQYYTTRIS